MPRHRPQLMPSQRPATSELPTRCSATSQTGRLPAKSALITNVPAGNARVVIDSTQHVIQATLKIAFVDDLSTDEIQLKVKSLVHRA